MQITLMDSRTIKLTDIRNEHTEIRKIISAAWNRKENAWVLPVTALQEASDLFGRESLSDELKDILQKQKHTQRYIQHCKTATQFDDMPDFLLTHQKQCLAIARTTPRYGFFLDTGTGKTVVGLSILAERPERYVIVCPQTIIKAAWLSDADKFYPGLRILPLCDHFFSKEFYEGLAKKWGVPHAMGLRKAPLVEMLQSFADHYIVNPESFGRLDPKQVNGLLLDESAVIKNGKANITKQIVDFVEKHAKAVYLFSGLPAPNNEMEYFWQIRVLDRSLLGSSFYKFRLWYFNAGYNNFSFTLKPDMRQELTRRIACITHTVRKHECLDLPEKTYETRLIALSKEANAIYRKMLREQLLVLKDTTISAPHKLTALLKLRQVASGFIYDEKHIVHHLHSHKVDELEKLLYELGDKQVIIWVQFKPEVDMICRMLQKSKATFVTACSDTKDIKESIDAFAEGRAQYIIAHPGTLRYGVTFTNCSYAVYYSVSYSYNDYYQSHDRIYRMGQKNMCTFLFLTVDVPSEHAILGALDSKKDMSEVIQNLIKEVDNERKEAGNERERIDV